jgi:Fe-Mn family superoxide dismutase
MKVSLNYINGCDLSNKDKNLMKKFIVFLNKKYPLNNDVKITFTGKRFGGMSSGSRTNDSELKILTNGRLNRDVIRTLAHEWVHEYQINVLNREHGPNIGGKNEDEANAEAGSLIKKFEKSFPEKEEMMYEGINNKLNLLKEQIVLTEKKELQKDLILEMKKIGIEKLPYAYSAMKQFVDPETMDIHYNKHYKGYVKKLNDQLKNKKYKYIDLEQIIKSISRYDDNVRNNAGGAFNHALFWKMLSPKKQNPKGEIFEKIKADYGNIKKLKDKFNEVAKERFGSGWVWLVLLKNGKLKIMSTSNQDNPLMNVVKSGGYPLLGLDLWEHAYYLRYRNKRDEYIKKFWNHINWDFVNDLYVSKSKKTLKESYFKILKEDKEIQPDLKYAMDRELQKIRLIPLDAEAASVAINNIITAEIDRGLNFNRTIQGLMSLDLSNTSERTQFRFNNYYQRFIKSRTRGFDFEALVSGLLGGQLSDSLDTPYDVITPNNEYISCKIIKDSSQAPTLKNIRNVTDQYIKNYTGDEDNKQKLIDYLEGGKDLIYNLVNSGNSDLINIGEDLIEKSLEGITGMLLGIPKNDFKINLYYYSKEKLKNILKLSGYTNKSRSLGTTQIRFSTKILKLEGGDVGPIKGSIQFPEKTYDEYVEFLIGDDKTKEILNIFNALGAKYGVSNLGGNIPQDVIRDLSKNYRFKRDILRLIK